MDVLWRRRVVRRLGIFPTAFLVTITLGGCLGWSTQLSTNDGASFNGIACPSLSTCLLVGTSTTGKGIILATHDGGASWLSSAVGVSSGGLNAISCADTDHCVAVGASGSVLATADGGSTWSVPTTLPSVASDVLTSISFPDDQHCWGVDKGPVI